MTRRIQLRRDTTTNWESADPILSAGEVGVDLTTGQIKIGNGSVPWTELNYYSGSDVDLTEYATKEYVDDAIAAIPPGPGEVDLSGYATEQYVDDAVGAIVIPDVSNFITAQDIPAIPADISDLTDTDGLLGGGGTQLPSQTGQEGKFLRTDGEELSWVAITSSGSTGNILFNGNDISNSVDNEISVTTEKTITTNNSYTNDTDFSTDIDIGGGTIISGWSQRNSEQIEFSFFGPTEFRSFLTGLILGRTVIVTYSTANGNQTLTGTLTQQFTNITEQEDPSNPGWSRVAGRIDATLPVDQTGIVSVNFPVYSLQSNSWEFDTDGNLTLPLGGDIVDSNGDSVLGGSSEGLPTITVPATTGTTYKGLQVAYGGFHSYPNNSDKRNVTKVVIHKPAATAVDITDDSNSDFFQVSGLSGDSVLAMFVVIGDVNGAKPLSDIKAFAEEVIDTVILDGGVEGEFNTVDEMKAAFYANYADLASAVGGLATDFEFYQNYVPALNGGVTTVREGTGATFDITANGDETYSVSDPAGTGANYLVDHRIKILGTDLGGATPDNDLELQVSSVNESGGITSVFSYGTSVGLGVYTLVSGTNYNVGSGFAVNGVYKYETYLDTRNNGSNYVVGDVITLLGSNITNGTSPENDITITVRNVFGSGEVNGFDISGTVPEVWRTNNISDGGNDEYDTGNFINSSYLDEIAYNSGNTVTDGAAAFGTGSSYSFVYKDSVFGLFVTGNNSTTIGTSGNGPDSGSTIISGYIYGPNTAERTFANAVTHLNIVGNPVISFTKTNNGDEVDVLIADDGEGAGVGITRDNNGGIYNPYRDDGWDEDVSPSGTQWNIDGWDNLTNVESRTYQPLYAAFGFGGLGNKIVGAECVMYLPDNDKYYAVKFTQWTQNNAGGGFAYTRQELDLDSPDLGIRFADGTRQTTAYVPPTTVKLVSPRERRIEEVYGYKEVAVTSRTVDQEFTGITLSPTLGFAWDVYISGTAYPEFYAYVSNFQYQEMTLSINGVEYTVQPYISGSNIILYSFNPDAGSVPVNYNEGDAFTVTKFVGGEPVTWWNKSELPGGSSDFRGAVIDYHAFISGRGTIVGTIHIVDDDGEENITHTEVSSGSSSLEYSDLWLVTDEGRIRYRQLDGDNRTLKVQWTAKVFYGSEYYDD
jgi:hypothetical protein